MACAPTATGKVSGRLRRLVPLIGALAVAAAVTLTVGAAPVEAAYAPRVVIVVGPSGGATRDYLRKAREYAAQAKASGASVTSVLTPHATWERVIAAAQGANVFIYLGHGNGWPSRYAPYQGITKNGLGLNPRDGSGNTQGQVLRRGPRPGAPPPRAGCHRPAQPAVLRVRQRRARLSRAFAEHGGPARGQLRGRLPRRGCGRRGRGRAHQPRLRAGRPVRPGSDPAWRMDVRPGHERARPIVRLPADPGHHCPPGPGPSQQGLLPVAGQPPTGVHGRDPNRRLLGRDPACGLSCVRGQARKPTRSRSSTRARGCSYGDR